MDMERKDQFLRLWHQYFPGVELPITFYYTQDGLRAQHVSAEEGHRCLIGDLAAVRRGESLCFDVSSIACFGGRRNLGFSQDIRPNIEYFLSCGIPGVMDGERYKKSPELVRELMQRAPVFKAPAPYVVFKRWDELAMDDEPEVVIFFARPDVLAGLFTLAGFDESDPNAVMCPFGAGCAKICCYPYLEKDKEHPHAFIGLFDVSARPWVPKEVLSFAVPMTKFTPMIDNMDESFLTTPSWEKVRARLHAPQPNTAHENHFTL